MVRGTALDGACAEDIAPALAIAWALVVSAGTGARDAHSRCAERLEAVDILHPLSLAEATDRAGVSAQPGEFRPWDGADGGHERSRMGMAVMAAAAARASAAGARGSRG